MEDKESSNDIAPSQAANRNNKNDERKLGIPKHSDVIGTFNMHLLNGEDSNILDQSTSSIEFDDEGSRADKLSQKSIESSEEMSEYKDESFGVDSLMSSEYESGIDDSSTTDFIGNEDHQSIYVNYTESDLISGSYSHRTMNRKSKNEKVSITGKHFNSTITTGDFENVPIDQEPHLTKVGIEEKKTENSDEVISSISLAIPIEENFDEENSNKDVASSIEDRYTIRPPHLRPNSVKKKRSIFGRRRRSYEVKDNSKKAEKKKSKSRSDSISIHSLEGADIQKPETNSTTASISSRKKGKGKVEKFINSLNFSQKNSKGKKNSKTENIDEILHSSSRSKLSDESQKFPSQSLLNNKNKVNLYEENLEDIKTANYVGEIKETKKKLEIEEKDDKSFSLNTDNEIKFATINSPQQEIKDTFPISSSSNEETLMTEKDSEHIREEKMLDVDKSDDEDSRSILRMDESVVDEDFQSQSGSESHSHSHSQSQRQSQSQLFEKNLDLPNEEKKNLNEWDEELKENMAKDLEENRKFSKGLKLYDWQGLEIPFNSLKPVPFENDFFKGKFLFLLKPPKNTSNNDHNVETLYDEYFEVRKAALEFQIQGEFKIQPEGTLYMGGELPFPLDLGFGLRSMANVCMGIARQFDPLLHFSFGQKEDKTKKMDSSEYQKAHCTWPLVTGMDRIIKSPKNSTALPKLGGLIPEPDNERALRKSGKTKMSLETDYIYTMAFGCSMVDLINWKATFGSTNIDLKSYLGINPMQIVVYALDDEIAKGKGGHYEKDKRLIFYLELSPTFFRDALEENNFDRPVMVTSKSSVSVSGAGFVEEEKPLNDSSKENYNRESYENFDGFLDYALKSRHGYKIEALSFDSMSENEFQFDDGLIEEGEFSEPGEELEEHEETEEAFSTTDELDVSSINTDEICLFETSSDDESDNSTGDSINNLLRERSYVENLQDSSHGEVAIHRSDWHLDENYVYLSDSESEEIGGLYTYLSAMDSIERKEGQFYFYSNPYTSKHFEKKEDPNNQRSKKYILRKFGGNYSSLREKMKTKVENLKKSIYEAKKAKKKNYSKIAPQKRNNDNIETKTKENKNGRGSHKIKNGNAKKLSITEEMNFKEEKQNLCDENITNQRHCSKVEDSLIQGKQKLVRKGEKLIRLYSELERLQQKKHGTSQDCLRCVHVNIAHWHSIALIVQFLLLISVTIGLLVFHENSGNMIKELKGYNTNSKYSPEEYVDIDIRSLSCIASSYWTALNQNSTILVESQYDGERALTSAEVKVIEESNPKYNPVLESTEEQHQSFDNKKNFSDPDDRMHDENETLMSSHDESIREEL